MKKRVDKPSKNKFNCFQIALKPIIFLVILNIIALISSFFAPARMPVAIIITILTLVTFIYAGYITTKKYKQRLLKAFAIGILLGIVQGILFTINMVLQGYLIEGYIMPMSIPIAAIMTLISAFVIGGITTLAGLVGKIKKK